MRILALQMSLLSTAFQAALTAIDSNFQAWAKAAGINYTTAHTCLSRDARPNDKLLRAFCTKWPRPDIGINLLRAYLRDEVRRAGFSAGDVEVLLPGELAGPNLDKDLLTLRDYLLRQPDMREAIKAMARIAGEEMAQCKTPYHLKLAVNPRAVAEAAPHESLTPTAAVPRKAVGLPVPRK
jgi:hypothetical protein